MARLFFYRLQFSAMNTHPVQLTTITPVHIGSGIQLNPNFEYLYFQDEREVAVIDVEKVFDILGEENLSNWVSIILKEEDLLNYLRKQHSTLSADQVAQWKILVEGAGPTRNNALRMLQHTGPKHHVLVPGSSLKGPFRTAVLRSLILQDPIFASDPNHLGFEGRRGMVFKDQQVVAHYFGAKNRPNRKGELVLDANRDFMRFFRVSDFIFPQTTECRKLEIINDFRGTWAIKKKETSFVECIPQDATASGSINIPQQLLNLISNNKFSKTEKIRAHQNLLDIPTLFKKINQLTLELVKAELDFWDDEQNPYAIGDYMEILGNIENQLKSIGSDTCIFRVGAGSGWDFMTGAWARKEDILDDDVWEDLKQFIRRRNYPGKVSFPKTRKLLEGGMPLGFVKMELKK